MTEAIWKNKKPYTKEPQKAWDGESSLDFCQHVVIAIRIFIYRANIKPGPFRKVRAVASIREN